MGGAERCPAYRPNQLLMPTVWVGGIMVVWAATNLQYRTMVEVTLGFGYYRVRMVTREGHEGSAYWSSGPRAIALAQYLVS